MARIIRISVAVLTLLTALPLPSHAQEPSFATAAHEAAEKIAAAFPKLEGLVIAIEGGRALLDLGEKDRVYQGMELQVYRPGEDIRHPITGVVLGKMEKDLGRVKVAEVREGYSLAEPLGKTDLGAILKGDRVRVTAARILLALPNIDPGEVKNVDPRAVSRELSVALSKTGRFEILEERRLRATLAAEKMAKFESFNDPAILQVLTEKLKVNALALGKLTPLPQGTFLDVQVISAATGRPLTLASVEVKAFAPRYATVPPPGYPMPPTARPGVLGPEFIKGPELPFKGRAMAVGDFTGDGKKKVAVTDGEVIYIYAFDKGTSRQIWAQPDKRGNNIIALDAADINGNGKAEIFVTNYYGGRLTSYVLEYKGGDFVRVWDKVGLFFRVLPLGEGGKDQLYAQKSGTDKLFTPPIRQYVWSGGSYKEGPILVSLDNLTLYGFTIGDVFNDGSRNLVLIDQGDRLQVYDLEGHRRYRSTDHYGGSEASLEFRPLGAAASPNVGDPAETIVLQGRVYLQTSRSDGKKDLILWKNIPSAGYLFKNLKLYERSKLYDLRWDGLSFQTVWESREMDGYISDYSLVDLDGDGQLELVALLVQSRLLETPRTTIVVYKLGS